MSIGPRDTSTNGGVAMRQVHVDAVEVVRPEGAARAALVPVGPEHEMLHDELAAAVEQVGRASPCLRAPRRRSPSRPSPRAARDAPRASSSRMRVNSFSLARSACAPPAIRLGKRCDAWSCCPPQEGLELVERAAPALVVGVAARRVGERAVDQRQLGLVAERAELEAHRRLVAARARRVVGGVMRPGEDQALGPLDLDIACPRSRNSASRCGRADARRRPGGRRAAPRRHGRWAGTSTG